MVPAQLLDRWQRLRATEWAPKTAHDHHGTVDRWIVPWIGDVRVIDLRRTMIEGYYADLGRRGGVDGKPLSPTSVRKTNTVLHAALEDEVSLELIAGNPSTKARRPKVTKHVALRWSDINDTDLDAGTIHIQRSITKLSGQRPQVKATKTGATALLAVDAGTIHALRAWRRQQTEINLAVGRGRLQQSDWVFPSKDLTQPINPDVITYRWTRLAAANDLDVVRLHDLRHAAATHMVAAGIDIRTVAGRLRHASPAMTLDVYAGRDLPADRAAATLMGTLIDGD